MDSLHKILFYKRFKPLPKNAATQQKTLEADLQPGLMRGLMRIIPSETGQQAEQAVDIQAKPLLWQEFIPLLKNRAATLASVLG